MDEITNNEIEEYLSDLPTAVLNVAQDKTWPKRVAEIAVKYSLTEEQATVLQNLVMFVIIGVEQPENFAQSVETELGISKLLTEQIVKDIDTRVFQYVFDFISRPGAEIADSPEPSVAKVAETEIPEVRPEILPLVEENEKTQIKSPPEAVDKNFVPENLPGVEIKEQKTFVGSDFAQKPVAPASATPQNPPPPPKYTIDPYREPIE
jgi:hypothetical protein